MSVYKYFGLVWLFVYWNEVKNYLSLSSCLCFMDQYSFQYCQKLVIFSRDKTKVLLGKRKGEADYDGVFSFFGGKMEVTDASFLAGLKREKNEELGAEFRIQVYPLFTYNLPYTKRDGRKMVLPHYYAVHVSGEPHINEEYEEVRWVSLDDLDSFESKVETIPATVREISKLEKIIKKGDMILI